MESALQAAQQEATNYRSESKSLVQKLGELQARYNSLQTEQSLQLVASLHGGSGAVSRLQLCVLLSVLHSFICDKDSLLAQKHAHTHTHITA